MEGFLVQALVYLAAAVILVPFAKRIGLGSVLGYLLAGVVIGPDVMGWIGDERHDIMHFAEFGVVMMLFVVGLELRPSLLWKLRTSILGLGGLQVTLTAIIVTGACFALELPLYQSTAIGLTVAMSSTAIVLQTMTEKGLSKSESGQNAFSVLLFQDIAVIPILAVFPLLAPADVAGAAVNAHPTLIENLPGWLQTLCVLGAVAIIVGGGHYALRPFFRMIAKTGLREVFTAAVLLLVAGIAVLMQQVGLSPALGTFLAGVVLANNEYRHELESDIEPFKGLLLGLFFIAVGASIDFTLISSEPALIFGIVFGLMAVKTLVLALIGKFFGMKIDQNVIFAFALSQIGEFAFVLFSFASSQNILPAETVNIMVAAVAISMALTPMIFLLTERLILPRVGVREQTGRDPDRVEDKERVLIAGFDKFGNIVGRFLNANGVATTVLDNDSDRVELLRKLGLKVYYGDPTRLDLLHAAGAAEASLIVVALEETSRSIELVHTAKKHFPAARIYARALDRNDAYALLDAGADKVYRETLDTSLRVGVDVLCALGHRSYSAHRAAMKFRKHDELAFMELNQFRGDRKRYLNAARERISELEALMLADQSDKDIQLDESWDSNSLREEVRSNSFTPTS